jgi:hypothetical protein
MTLNPGQQTQAAKASGNLQHYKSGNFVCKAPTQKPESEEASQANVLLFSRLSHTAYGYPDQLTANSENGPVSPAMDY